MTKRLLTLGLPWAALLTGCQTQALPGAVGVPSASTSVRSVSPAAAPRVLDQAQVRRLMQAAGTASLWGVTYSQSYSSGTRRAGTGSNWWYENYSSFSGNAAFSGKGQLQRVAYNRFVYPVPADQVLVLNTIEGNGQFFINGFSTIARGRVHYLFGPGEQVILNFNPAVAVARYYDYGRQSYWATSYQPLTMSGFTVSPNLLGATGALGGAR